MRNVDVCIIGGGPAGLAAALSARKEGIENILILERETFLGGILNQCIHNGFGLHTFKEELTGPEYAARYVQMVEEASIPVLLDTMVIDISKDKVVTAISPQAGLIQIQAISIVLAMGCRERPRGALNIPGFRPSGIYSAGTAQRYVNIEGFLPGKEVVILGSGDIGLIMARRMTLEGAHVLMVCEILPFSGGLKRNIVQCLDDFNIPLRLSHTITKIHGKYRVEGVTVQQVSLDKTPIAGTEEFVACDTILLSVGLIPENELSRKAGLKIHTTTQGPLVNDRFETSIPGVFACGNVLHVHDLVDWVSQEAEFAGQFAAQFVKLGSQISRLLPIVCGYGIRYTVPTTLCIDSMKTLTTVRFRVTDVFKDYYLDVFVGQVRVSHQKKRIVAPGEMESILFKKHWLDSKTEDEEITILLQKE
ncbi:MAG: FAD-dependent oxidoreductase [Candidatus Izemoplasmatales bacterium]|nr:FAD-dependent oxidoreductase [bacterium]MDZ4197532.1 FAD-dependent oxidoreductase [Candidatus Izemoplasmatales bacterium]